MPLVEPKTGVISKEIVAKDGRVFLIPSDGNLRGIESGIIIECKNCREQEIVAKGSLCHTYCLGVKCMRRRLPF